MSLQLATSFYCSRDVVQLRVLLLEEGELNKVLKRILQCQLELVQNYRVIDYIVVLVKLVMRKLTVNTAITVVTYICCPPLFASTNTFFNITLH